MIRWFDAMKMVFFVYVLISMQMFTAKKFTPPKKTVIFKQFMLKHAQRLMSRIVGKNAIKTPFQTQTESANELNIYLHLFMMVFNKKKCARNSMNVHYGTFVNTHTGLHIRHKQLLYDAMLKFSLNMAAFVCC